MKFDIPPRWLPLIGAAALWAPAMLAASYAWGHGEYYDYGWFVPPAALWLMARRWQGLDGALALPRGAGVVAGAALLLPWILVRRLPTILLGLTAAGVSHGLLATSRGWRVSAGFGWITLLWLSALPWPSVAERWIVHHLTQWVVASVAGIFQTCGRPVAILGDRLCLYDVTVEVTDGCSGVRSFQSFVMATWFFAELQRLRVSRALTLLGCACLVAFLVNLARTYILAQIRFNHGKAAFDQAHDALGLLAFGVSGLIFYALSGRLAARPARIVVKTVQGL